VRIVSATALSDANGAATGSRTCPGCLGNTDVREVHPVTVVPDNVSSGLPGMEAATDARRALASRRAAFARGSTSRRTSPADRRADASTASPTDAGRT
jgi:hypothetical protein